MNLELIVLFNYYNYISQYRSYAEVNWNATSLSGTRTVTKELEQQDYTLNDFSIWSPQFLKYFLTQKNKLIFIERCHGWIDDFSRSLR